MTDSILTMIVKATPTEKDDKLVEFIRGIKNEYPDLKDFLLDILIMAIQYKTSKNGS